MRTLWIACLCLSACSSERPVNKSVLPSGLTLISERRPVSPLVSLQINIRGGLASEAEGQDGLAYLVANLLFRGTETRSNEEILAELEYLSARVNVVMAGDYTAITLTCLDENFDAAWSVLAECLSRPKFDTTFFRLQKVGLMNEIQASQDDLSDRAVRFFRETAYRGQAYAHSDAGREGTLPGLRFEDVTDYYERFYRAPNTVIVISSSRPHGAIEKFLDTSLAAYSQKTSEWKPVLPVARTPVTDSLAMPKNQTILQIAYALPPPDPETYPVHVVVAHMLGGGVGSRLWRLRQEGQLAYVVTARLDQFAGGGMIRSFMGTTGSKRQTARTALMKTIRDFARGPVDARELEASKSSIRGDLMRGMESGAGRVARMSFFEMIGFGYDYPDKLIGRIQSLDHIETHLPSIFDEKKQIVVLVGNLE